MSLEERKRKLEAKLGIPLEPSSVLVQQFLDKNIPGAIRIPDFDNLIANRVKAILTSKPVLLNTDGIRSREFQVLDVHWNSSNLRTPQACRILRSDYTMKISIDVALVKKKDGIVESMDTMMGAPVGDFPVMTYSSHCRLRDKSDRELIEMGEDPAMPRGCFIYNGIERYIESQEQLSTGTMFIYKMKKGEAAVNMTVRTNNGTMVILIKGNEKKPEGKNRNEIQMSLTTLHSRSKDPNDPASSLLNVVRIVRLLSELKKYYSFREFCLTFYNPSTGITFDTHVNNCYATLVEQLLNGTLPQNLYQYVDFHSYSKLPEPRPAYPEFDFEEMLGYYLDPKARKKCMSLFCATMHHSYVDGRDDLVFFNKLLSLGKKGTTYDINHLTPVDLYNNVANIISRDVFPNINDIIDDINDISPKSNPGVDDDVWTRESARVQNDKIDRKIHMVIQGVSDYLEFRKGFRKVNDRDSWSIKRAVGAAALLEQLVRTWIFKCSSNLRSNSNTIDSIQNAMASNRFVHITELIMNSFTTAFWNGVSGRVKENITHDVPKTSMAEAYSAFQIINVNVPRTKNIPKAIRNVQDTQYNGVCCVFTPDGDNTGLPKNLSLTAIYSRESDDSVIIQSLRSINGYTNEWGRNILHMKPTLPLIYIQDEFGSQVSTGTYALYEVESFTIIDNLLVDRAYNSQNPYVSESPLLSHKMLVNGKFLGWIVVPAKDLYQNLVSQRRENRIQNDVGIILKKDRIVVDTTASRIIFPYYVVNASTGRLVVEEMMEAGYVEYDLDVLFTRGAIEYISPGEQEYSRVAVYTSDVAKLEKNILDARDELERHRGNLSGADPSILEEERAMILYYDEQNRNSATPIPERELVDKIYDKEILERANDYRGRVSLLKAAENKLRDLEKEEKYKYCQLDPQTYLSYIANMIFYLNHNQSPRITFTINMLKQASGCYSTNYENLIDDKIKILMRREQPLIQTEVTARDKFHCIYTNVNHAFFSCEGDEEDAMIMNRDALLMGKFRLIKSIIYKYRIETKQTEASTQSFRRPVVSDRDKGSYKHIGENGLPYIGAYLRQRDCVIGVVQTKNGMQTNVSTLMRVGEQGQVTNVYMSTNPTKGVTTVTVRITLQHIPEKGDKFTVGNAQKDTIGNIRPRYELVSTEDGVTFDTAYNATCLPSRMTYSFMMMLIAATAAACSGQRKNASPHRKTVGFDLAKYSAEIASMGLHPLLETKMYSPQTSNALTGTIFMGLCPFISLKHLAAQKIQARSRGAIKTGSRQPTKGKKYGGGGRIGEMEKDTFVAHGAASLVQQCLMKQSDMYVRVVCRNCNATAITGPSVFKCVNCGNEDQSKFAKCELPYSFETLQQYLSAACIDLSTTYISQKEIREEIARRQQVANLDNVEDEDMEEEVEEEEEFPDYLTGFSENIEITERDS
jgi:DNA-directed RNA polymerase subunit B'